MVSSDQNELTFKLDPKCTKKFTTFFSDLDKVETLKSLGIESYKVQVTSLEDIFNKTGR